MRWPGLLLVLLLFSCRLEARAELTDVEKLEVRKLHGAILAAESGLTYLGLVVRDCSTDALRPDLQAAWRSLAQGMGGLNRGAAFLIGANPDDGTQAAFNDAQPREWWVSTAWSSLDRATGRLDVAREYLRRARAVQTCGAATDDNLRRAVEIWLTAAISRVMGVDRSLVYADPRPLSYPQVIGPHGNWDVAVRVGARSQVFLNDALARAAELYDTGEGSYSSYYGFHRIALRTVNAGGLIRSTWLNLAMIPLNDNECKKNRFRLVADGLGRVTSHDSGSHGVHGAPYDFHNGQLEAVRYIAYEAEARPLARQWLEGFLARWTDAWRHSDGMAWQVLVFPSDEVLNQIRGQRSEGDGPFGPPICQ